MSGHRCLLVAFAERGHLNPVLALAQHLEDAGIEVGVASGSAEVVSAVARAGLRGRAFCTAAAGHDEQSLTSGELAARLACPRWLRQWTWRVLIANARTRVPSLGRAIDELAPDLVITDAMAYDGAIAAERAHLPWVSLATGLQFRTDGATSVYRQLHAERAGLFTAHGVSAAFRGSDVLSPFLNLALVAPALIPPPVPADTHFLGAVLPRRARGDEPAFPWDRLPADRPLVIVSFGSHLSPPLEVTLALIHAAVDAGAFVIASGKDQDLGAVAGPQVLVLPYLPQLALLRRAALLVCHGGANSVMEALAHGVPVCVVPLVYDQPVIGDAVTRAGLGACVTPGEVAALAGPTLARLLDPDAPERARALASALELGRGGERAIALVAGLLERGRT